MNLVISQPMYFPWVGLLEQIKLADIFVHYDDVQFTRGFYNRVQIKSDTGIRWLTVPIKKHARETDINQIAPDDSTDWREQHRRSLTRCYQSAPYFGDMMDVFEEANSIHTTSLAEVSRRSIMALAKYFKIDRDCLFISSSSLGVSGRSSARLIEICRELGATTYITGHGARNYLDHELFELNGMNVEYMNYVKFPYPQQNGVFTPYVSGLDLIANCGQVGVTYICSGTTPWRDSV